MREERREERGNRSEKRKERREKREERRSVIIALTETRDCNYNQFQLLV